MRQGTMRVMVLLIFLMLGHLSALYIDSPDTRNLIYECQKELPRNEHCKLIAVPDKGE